jgi:hypothetical protein
MKLAGGLLALVGKYIYIARCKRKNWESMGLPYRRRPLPDYFRVARSSDN